MMTRIVVVVAVLVAAVPSSSTATTPATTPSPAWVGREALREPPDKALSESLASMDPATIEEARKRMLTAPAAMGGSGMTAAQDVACALACEPIPAGDLDGDGDDDIVVVERRTSGWDAPATYALTARQVAGGAILWERSFARTTLYFSAASTIRGFEGDLIVMEYEIHQYYNDSVIRRIDGATGQDVWARWFPGSGLGTNLLAEIQLIPATATRGAAVMGGFLNGWLLASVTYTGRLLDAGTGADLAEATAAGGVGPAVGFYRLPRVAPLPAADARGRLGLVAISQMHNQRIAVATVAGDPVPLWTSVLEPPGTDQTVVWRPFSNLIDDLDGDGISDVLVSAYAYLSFPFDRCAGSYCTVYLSTSNTMLSGGAGRAAWTRFIPFGIPLAPTGDGDIRAVRFPSDFTVESFTLDGATGTEANRTSYTAPVPGGSAGYAVACLITCAPDLDGDGTVDLLATFAGNLPSGHPATPPVVAIGGTGATLWTRNRSTTSLPEPARGDGDGDGVIDLIDVSWSVDESSEVTLVVRLVSGATGTDLWATDIPILRRYAAPIDFIFSRTTFATRANGRSLIVAATEVADEDFRVYGAMAVADQDGVRWRL